MSGNVYEWCQDVWHMKYEKVHQKRSSAWMGRCGAKSSSRGSWRVLGASIQSTFGSRIASGTMQMTEAAISVFGLPGNLTLYPFTLLPFVLIIVRRWVKGESDQNLSENFTGFPEFSSPLTPDSENSFHVNFPAWRVIAGVRWNYCLFRRHSSRKHTSPSRKAIFSKTSAISRIPAHSRQTIREG